MLDDKTMEEVTRRTLEQIASDLRRWEAKYAARRAAAIASKLADGTPCEPSPHGAYSVEGAAELHRQGYLSRPAPDQPRGTRATAAEARITGPYLSLHHGNPLVESDEEDVQIAAAGVLSEYAGVEHVRLLGAVLAPRTVRVRCAAAHALGMIGGPLAEQYLLRTIEGDAPLLVREEALLALINLVSGGWETYQMSPARMELPKDLRHRLEALTVIPGLGRAITTILRAFD